MADKLTSQTDNHLTIGGKTAVNGNVAKATKTAAPTTAPVVQAAVNVGVATPTATATRAQATGSRHHRHHGHGRGGRRLAADH